MDLDLDALSSLRAITLAITLFVLVVFGVRYIRAFQFVSMSQRLYIGATLLFLITLSWDTWEFFAEDAPFSWRILPLVAGLTLCVIYLLEPYEAARRRFGREPYDAIMASDEERRLATENAELKDQLYQALRRENTATLKALELETAIENARKVGS